MSELSLAASSASEPRAEPSVDGEIVPAEEEAATAAVVQHVRDSVQAGYDKTGKAFRDAHRKAHGCVQASFTVLDQLPPKLAQGLFAAPRSYSAVVRYSNGSGSSQDDRSADGRGMAVKVTGVAGPVDTQDFLMINHPVFFVRDAVDYVGFQNDVGGGGLAAAGWLLRHLFHETRIIVSAATTKVLNPLNSPYWSMTPYKLGTEQMKYAAKPCSGGTFYEKSDTPNRLGDNMAIQLSMGGACFDFMVQTRTVPAEMPIEDPTIEWSEVLSPFVPVARIAIPSQTPEAAEVCEARSYTPWHNLPEHRPLGGISRVRQAVYEASANLRKQLNAH